MCKRGAEQYLNTYVSRARENVPCNWLVIAAFFVIFTLLDHIRGLGTLIGLLVLLPLHCNKRANDEAPARPLQSLNTQNLIVLCTETPGVHRSCSALYFWCAANGITESLALILHGPVEKAFPAVVQMILVFCLLGLTLLIAALLIDSLTISPVVAHTLPVVVDVESPPPKRHTTICPAPI
jgi:hypothetical protein